MTRCRYEILHSDGRRCRIADVGHTGHMSVTNDVENVVAELHRLGHLKELTALTYIDSEGIEDQIIHDGHGKFVRFEIIPSARRN